MIYGTVRMIEKDDETFLAWARDRYACVIFNLHIDHTPESIGRAAETFRQLIDLGITCNGSYYLTYHRWARQDQVECCYPQMREFLARKWHRDPPLWREWLLGECLRYYELRALIGSADAIDARSIIAARRLERDDARNLHPRDWVGTVTPSQLGFDGSLDTCIAIRTAVIADGVCRVQAGAGIVADSDPRAEEAETRAKAGALLRAVELVDGQAVRS